MTQLTDEEIDLVASNYASVVHCPSSNLKLASGFCPVAKLIAKGANVALGTDGASSNNTLDMLAETKLAAILAKGVAKDAEVIPARMALRMATLNGAKALGLDSVCGSLTAGKSADMIAVELGKGPEVWPAPNSCVSPGFDPVTHLIYSSTRNQVSDVWVAGKPLMRNRRLTTLNLSKLQKSSESWGTKIKEFLVKKATEANAAEA
jgi:5-methylthioadenosine/S-adenosylhomocysteine deaminase